MRGSGRTQEIDPAYDVFREKNASLPDLKFLARLGQVY